MRQLLSFLVVIRSNVIQQFASRATRSIFPAAAVTQAVVRVKCKFVGRFGENDSERVYGVCAQIDNILNTCCELVVKLKKLWTNSV